MKAIKEKKCFVIMPFSVREGDKEKYNDPSHWSEVYAGLIEPAVTSAGFRCIRDDADIGSRLIVEGILKKIEEADLVLCDLSSHNPNVFLELGWALRADRPIVLIKDELTQFTFDLNQQYTFEYASRLQPTILSKQVKKLNEVINYTQGDLEARYSVVKRLGISAKAIEAASQGDYQTQMLLELQRKVESLGQRNSTSFSFKGCDFDEWPVLLQRATLLMSNVREHLASIDPTAIAGHTFIDEFRTMTKTWEACASRSLQVSLLGERQRFTYHDWEEMIGAKAYWPGSGGETVYQEVFRHPFGAIAWIDQATNIKSQLYTGSIVRRFNIGLFSYDVRTHQRIVVEAHQELT
jgi:hypothetical protein